MRTARVIITGLVLVAGSFLNQSTWAQQSTTIVPYTATWRYEQSGTDLGTAWRANAFVDTAWASGNGLLEGGEGTAYPEPFGAVIAAPNGTRITDYFRHTFFYNGTTNVAV